MDQRSHFLKQPGIASVAVFRALQLGDMLCAVPALRSLRAALPKASVTLISLPWARQFARRYSAYIDEFEEFPGHEELQEQAIRQNLVSGFYRRMRARQFSLALQMHGSGEISNRIVQEFNADMTAGYTSDLSGDCDCAQSNRCFLPYPEHGPEPLRLLNLVVGLGAPNMGNELEFPLLDEDWYGLKVSGLVDGLESRYLCIHPGARFRDKCWPPTLFANVADRLASEFGLDVVLTGGPNERDLTQAVADHMSQPAIDTAGPLSIGAMAALMSRAQLLICNDTGVSHIAAGLGLKSVVVFSRADIERWAPLQGHLHRCIWDPDGCKADEVLAQARQLLNETGSSGLDTVRTSSALPLQR